MTNTPDIRWYMTGSVAKILRGSGVAITYRRSLIFGAYPEAEDTRTYRNLTRAYVTAFDKGQAAQAMGVPYAAARDRLAILVVPEALVAVAKGVPYEWRGTAFIDRAEQALAAMEEAFGPIRSKTQEGGK